MTASPLPSRETSPLFSDLTGRGSPFLGLPTIAPRKVFSKVSGSFKAILAGSLWQDSQHSSSSRKVSEKAELEYPLLPLSDMTDLTFYEYVAVSIKTARNRTEFLLQLARPQRKGITNYRFCSMEPRRLTRN